VFELYRLALNDKYGGHLEVSDNPVLNPQIYTYFGTLSSLLV